MGTDNEDGSYTFTGGSPTGDPPPQLNNYSGGGAGYTLPQPGPGETWNIDDYDFAEVYLTVSNGTMGQVVRKKIINNTGFDLIGYPSGGQYLELQEGDHTFTVAVAETGGIIGFQRGRGGPSTWTITKVVYTKGATWHTITFDGGDYTAMPAIDPIKILDGRTVNFDSSYVMPDNPEWEDHTFLHWNTAPDVEFVPATPITTDITLTAIWATGVIPPEVFNVDLTLLADSQYDQGTDWKAELATATTNADDSVTFDFDTTGASGNLARQRAIILFTDEQAAKVNAGKTYEVEIEGSATGVSFRAGFLVEAGSGSNWNSTNLPTPAFDDGLATFTLTREGTRTSEGIVLQTMAAGIAQITIKSIKVTVYLN
jgi:hypothetical protein